MFIYIYIVVNLIWEATLSALKGAKVIINNMFIIINLYCSLCFVMVEKATYVANK